MDFFGVGNDPNEKNYHKDDSYFENSWYWGQNDDINSRRDD